MSVCVDDKANIEALSAEAKKQHVHIYCLVELECGAGRCGVADAALVTELAKTIDAADNLIFDGIQAYQVAYNMNQIITGAKRAGCCHCKGKSMSGKSRSSWTKLPCC